MIVDVNHTKFLHALLRVAVLGLLILHLTVLQPVEQDTVPHTTMTSTIVKRAAP